MLSARAGIESVEDTGAGIADDALALVRQRFYRTAEGRRRGDGSSLGPAIVDEICRRYDTRLVLDGRLGHGTRAARTLTMA